MSISWCKDMKRKAEMRRKEHLRYYGTVRYPRRLWTDEEKYNLSVMKADGLTHRDIARRLGRTIKSVEHMVRRLKLNKNNL